MVSDDKLRSTNERLKFALEERAKKLQGVDDLRKKQEADLQRQIAEQKELLEAVFAIPDEAERRKLLDDAGLQHMSAALQPLEPIRSAVQIQAPKKLPDEPKWAVWLALPRLKLWQCIALSLGKEPSGHIEKSMRNGRQINSRFSGLGVPPEFFDRLDYCKQALSTEGPISPQGPLYSGMLRDSGCAVLLKEVSSFLQLAEFKLPQQLIELTLPKQDVKGREESAEERQERRAKMCEEDGIEFGAMSLLRLPDGVGRVADREGVSRQAFSADVKAALERRGERKRGQG